MGGMVRTYTLLSSIKRVTTSELIPQLMSPFDSSGYWTTPIEARLECWKLRLVAWDMWRARGWQVGILKFERMCFWRTTNGLDWLTLYNLTCPRKSGYVGSPKITGSYSVLEVEGFRCPAGKTGNFTLYPLAQSLNDIEAIQEVNKFMWDWVKACLTLSTRWYTEFVMSGKSKRRCLYAKKPCSPLALSCRTT